MKERLKQAAENKEISRRDFLRGAVKGTLALGAATAGIDTIAKLTGLEDAEARETTTTVDRSKFRQMSREAKEERVKIQKEREQIQKEREANLESAIQKLLTANPKAKRADAIRYIKLKYPEIIAGVDGY